MGKSSRYFQTYALGVGAPNKDPKEGPPHIGMILADAGHGQFAFYDERNPNMKEALKKFIDIGFPSLSCLTVKMHIVGIALTAFPNLDNRSW